MAHRWHDLSFHDNYDTALILRNHHMMERLRDLPLLRHLVIHFSVGYLKDPDDAIKCWIPVGGFKNLTSLELYQCYNKDVNLLTKELAQAFIQCPKLKKLALGTSCGARAETTPETWAIEHKGSFFEKLCLEYGSLSPTPQPLALETLRLGHGVCLLRSTSGDVDNYFAKLVKLDELKVLHLFNGIVQFASIDVDDVDAEVLEIDFSLLEDCKSLQEVSLTRITPEVIRWLSGPARGVQELFITDSYNIYDPDLRFFSQLKLDRLSTLYTDEFIEGDPLSDTEESDSGDETPKEISSGASASTGGTSGFVVSKDIEVRTILDRLYERHDLSHLENLSFTFDFDKQWVSMHLTIDSTLFN